MTDRERATNIANGSEDEFRAFVADHYGSVLRFTRCLTRSVDDAEDLTQQAFIRAREHIGRFRGDASLRTWLHRLAFHEFTHWKRRRRTWLSLSRWEPASGNVFAQCEDAILILDALDQLPDAMREAFLLFEVQQLSLEEVAKVLRTPLGTVKSRLHHARLRLRSLLQDHEEHNYGTTICQRG